MVRAVAGLPLLQLLGTRVHEAKIIIVVVIAVVVMIVTVVRAVMVQEGHLDRARGGQGPGQRRLNILLEPPLARVAADQLLE